ncbi:MAG: LPS export ABC transporter periplasmic protein LptC [Alphaproteobacteria bacterium]|nr:LPS export ABC transporter periplasmic protein LptC [Alphaproteobacteria bacterium]
MVHDPQPLRVEDLFARLTRYTRFVLFSKWFLAIFAVLVIAFLIGWPLLTRDTSGMRVSFVVTENKDGSRAISPMMKNPRYQGVDKKGQKYTVTALQGVQRTPVIIDLEQVQADMFMTDESWLSLTADRAEFHDDSKLLYLLGNVTMFHDGGYSVVTERAVVDTNTSQAAGDMAVSGQGPMGNLLATGFEIRDNGNIIKFGGQGRVTMELVKAK